MVNDPSSDRGADAPDRDRGILSKSDREFIRAGAEQFEQDNSAPARLKRERAVRSRAYDAVLDFTLLLEYFERDDYTEVFWRDSDGEVSPPDNDEQLAEGIESAIAFLYRIVDSEPFDPWVARGVQRALNQQGFAARVGVEIAEEDKQPLEDVKQRYESEGVEAVSLTELEELERAGAITEEERREAARELLEYVEPLTAEVELDPDEDSSE